MQYIYDILHSMIDSEKIQRYTNIYPPVIREYKGRNVSFTQYEAAVLDALLNNPEGMTASKLRDACNLHPDNNPSIDTLSQRVSNALRNLSGKLLNNGGFTYERELVRNKGKIEYKFKYLDKKNAPDEQDTEQKDDVDNSTKQSLKPEVIKPSLNHKKWIVQQAKTDAPPSDRKFIKLFLDKDIGEFVTESEIKSLAQNPYTSADAVVNILRSHYEMRIKEFITPDGKKAFKIQLF